VDLPSLEGRTLVEGNRHLRRGCEAFRHPEPDCPDPIAELQSISDDDMERICGVFVRRMYPESKFSRDEWERNSAWACLQAQVHRAPRVNGESQRQ
jgi:hypothetical protein